MVIHDDHGGEYSDDDDDDGDADGTMVKMIMIAVLIAAFSCRTFFVTHDAATSRS